MAKDSKELTGRLIAIDAASNRHFDDNGYLHVADNSLTCDQVAGYYGFELPPSDDIDPERIYYAYRPAEELQKALDTYNGVPLLAEHEFDSPDEPLKELRVGSIGTKAHWDSPFIKNDLTIWDKKAIDKVLDGSLSDLSCGYTFEADWTAGKTADGVAYDFIMRGIKCNHVALVKKGRATDCRVADASLPIENTMENPEMEETAKCGDDFTEFARHAVESAGLELTAEQIDALVRSFAEAHAEYEKKAAENAQAETEGTRDEEDPKPEEAKPEESKDEEPKPEEVKAEESEEPAKEEPAKDEEEKAEEPAKAGDSDVIAKAVDAAKAHIESLYLAADAVAPVAGKIKPMSFKNPAEIYQLGLKSFGMAGVSDAAAEEVFKALLKVKGAKDSAIPADAEDDALTARIKSL